MTSTTILLFVAQIAHQFDAHLSQGDQGLLRIASPVDRPYVEPSPIAQRSLRSVLHSAVQHSMKGTSMIASDSGNSGSLAAASDAPKTKLSVIPVITQCDMTSWSDWSKCPEDKRCGACATTARTRLCQKTTPSCICGPMSETKTCGNNVCLHPLASCCKGSKVAAKDGQLICVP
ncbi:hypothetical protein AB6A40_005051 [Gnathostoma spinigerum]|uniref:Uncharacterized protein n=1 Tax=Gnathostoma spinigerum TaxID=75299 RepID=A0ABD6EGH5_9BILA